MIEYFYENNSEHKIGEAKSYTEFKNKIESNEFLCFLIQNPSEIDMKYMCKDFDLDEKPFKKFRTENRSLRYSFDPLAFAFIDYYSVNNIVKTSHLLFIVKKNLLILISSDSSSYHKELFKNIINKASTQKKHSAGYILYEFLHQDAKENYDVLESMDDKINELEDRVLSNNHETLITHDIIKLKKELVRMSKSLWASSKIIFTIKKDLTSIKLTKEDMSLLDDIYDTFLHQIDLIESQKETVTDYLEIFTTTISNRLAVTSNELNKVMKTMAALTIIIMIPTLIAGVYGTNFNYLPEITWKYGYLFLWGFMMIGSGITYLIFHKKKWI